MPQPTIFPLNSSYPPQQSMKAVWSSTVSYSFNPTAMTWAGGLVTVNAPEHQLATADTVKVTSTNGSSKWTTTSAVTVIDNNNFTYSLASDPTTGGTTPFIACDAQGIGMVVCNGGLFVIAEFVTISCGSYSAMMVNPTIIQVEQLPTNNQITVWGKVHPDASWVSIQVVADTNGLTQVVMNNLYALTRCQLTLGSGQPVVYAQY